MLTADDLAAVGLGLLKRADHVAVGPLVDQRPDQRAVGRGVADGQAAVGRHDALDEGVGHRAVRDHPAQRGAALTSRARGGEHDAAHRELEVGRRRHDRGVVAAEFEQRLAEPLGDPRPDLAAHAYRTRRRHQRDPRVVDQQFADLARALDQSAYGTRSPYINGGTFDERLACDGGQRGEFGRLPHHGVAADQRDGGVPRPHRDREVEGGDDADDAERMPGLHQPVARPLGGDGLAVQLSGEADGELADVDHLLHLAERLGGDLARLDGDQRARDPPCARSSSSPSRATNAPRTGAGVSRHVW